MRRYGCHEYNVMDGEPHLGKVTECLFKIDRDDLLQLVMEAMMEGRSFFTWHDHDIEIAEIIGKEGVKAINRKIEDTLLDDQYGDKEHEDLLFRELEDYIVEDYEFETQHYHF